MQVGLGWSALHAGLTSVAFAFGAAPAAGLSVQKLTPGFGRLVLIAGVLINAAGSLHLAVERPRYSDHLLADGPDPPDLRRRFRAGRGTADWPCDQRGAA
jgi:hypothetical protein